MVHTATITCMLSKNEYKNFIQLPESVWYQQEKKYHNDSYRDDGIRIVAYEVYEQKIFKGKVASCRINFRRLIEKDDKISVYVEADHDEVVKRFNEIMQMLQLPTWTYWTVNRMDYCVNVKTPYVKEYIALFQKGDIPSHQRLSYDRRTRNKSHKDGSLYLPARARDSRKRKNKTGSQTINFYDKQDELIKENATAEEIEQAKDILRLEVQCNYPKLDYIKRKYDLDRDLDTLLSAEISVEVLQRAILQVCHKGEYCRRSEALRRIDECRCHKSTKDKLKLIIKAVAKQRQSIAKVRDKFIEDGIMTREQFRNYIYKLDELNINPVTISDNTHLQDKKLKEGLSNIYDLYFDAVMQEVNEP
jgi:hypothetical protein